MRRPERDAAERLLEMPDRRHRDRVDHLLMELRVRLRRRQAVLGEHALVVQVDRLVETPLAGSASTTSMYSPTGPGLQVAFPRDRDRDLADAGRVELADTLGSKAKMRSLREEGLAMRSAWAISLFLDRAEQRRNVLGRSQI